MLASGAVFGQTLPARQEFEVASIKPSAPPGAEQVSVGVQTYVLFRTPPSISSTTRRSAGLYLVDEASPTGLSQALPASTATMATGTCGS
jgi:hypothetical protein